MKNKRLLLLAKHTKTWESQFLSPPISQMFIIQKNSRTVKKKHGLNHALHQLHQTFSRTPVWSWNAQSRPAMPSFFLQPHFMVSGLTFESLLVGGFKHFFCPIIYGIILPNWLIFFRGVETTNQINTYHCWLVIGGSTIWGSLIP